MKTRRLDNYGKINRDKILSFSWDKKNYKGFEGDTLASALLANNIGICLLYTSPSPRDTVTSRMPSSA